MKQEVMDVIEKQAATLVHGANQANNPNENRGEQASLNAYLSFNRKTKTLGKITYKTPCYGGIGAYITSKHDVLVNWVSVRNATDNWACWHGDSKYKFTKKDIIQYLSYLARRSPYQKAFLDKNATNMADKEFSIHPVKYAGNLIVGGMTAQRQLWEYTEIPHSFLMLRRAQPRSNPDWHFLLANMFDIKDDGTLHFQLKSGGHCPLDMSSFEMGEAKNFLSHKLAGASERPFYQTQNYYGITSLFRPNLDIVDPDYDQRKLYAVLKDVMRFPTGKLDLNNTLFAWNVGFTKVKQEALETYSLADVLPVFEDFYQQHFGGNA